MHVVIMSWLWPASTRMSTGSHSQTSIFFRNVFRCRSTGTVVEIDAGRIGSPSISNLDVPIAAAANIKIEEVRACLCPTLLLEFAF